MSSEPSKEMANLRASLQLKTDINAAREKLAVAALDVLRNMPTHRIVSTIQYLEKNLIPAIERKSGKSSADLTVFREIVDLLRWSAVVYDRLENQARINTHLQLDLTIMRERLILAEGELTKYQTVEDLMLTDALRHIEKGVRARIESDLKGKKSGF
jgi:hypothetical protein